jgi:hypothetical protein
MVEEGVNVRAQKCVHVDRNAQMHTNKDSTHTHTQECVLCFECLVGKQNKPTFFKVTEPSSVPYRTPSESRSTHTH